MLLLNIDYVPGKEVEPLGLVKGTVVQSKNFGKDFMAGMKTLVGGELGGDGEDALAVLALGLAEKLLPPAARHLSVFSDSIGKQIA